MSQFIFAKNVSTAATPISALCQVRGKIRLAFEARELTHMAMSTHSARISHSHVCFTDRSFLCTTAVLCCTFKSVC